jgi:hypothetical protein
MMTRRHSLMDGTAGTPAAGGGAPAPAPVIPAGGSATAILGQVSGDVGVAAAAPAADAAQWYAGIQNGDVKTWVEAKGFKDPLAVAESAYHLEKLIGFDRAGRTVVLPKDDASPEEISAFRSKLGVPETPDGYKLPVPQGQSDAFAKTAAAWMHEAGLTPKQAEAVAARWNEFQGTAAKAQAEALAKQGEADIGNLRGEWGAAFDKNLEFSKRAAAQFIEGTPDQRGEVLTKIEQAIGTGAMLKLFARIGEGLGEHRMVQNGDGGQIGVLTPAQARARIDALKSDKEWTKAYMGGDKAKIAELTRLHEWAYPEAAA